MALFLLAIRIFAVSTAAGGLGSIRIFQNQFSFISVRRHIWLAEIVVQLRNVLLLGASKQQQAHSFNEICRDYKLPSKSLVHLIHGPISQHPKYTLLSKSKDLTIFMLSSVNHRCWYVLVMNDCTGSLEIDQYQKSISQNGTWLLLCHSGAILPATSMLLWISKGNSIWSVRSMFITSSYGTSFWCPCEEHTAQANTLYATAKL